MVALRSTNNIALVETVFHAIVIMSPGNNFLLCTLYIRHSAKRTSTCISIKLQESLICLQVGVMQYRRCNQGAGNRDEIYLHWIRASTFETTFDKLDRCHRNDVSIMLHRKYLIGRKIATEHFLTYTRSLEKNICMQLIGVKRRKVHFTVWRPSGTSPMVWVIKKTISVIFEINKL